MEPSEASDTRIEMSKKKILIIDDSESVRTQVYQMLESMGIKGLVAENGEKGIEKIKENENITLIFCDVNMPVLDGISMLKRLKQENILMGGKKILPPIIMLTTESSKTMANSAKIAGAKGWIIKPLKSDVLAAIVESFAK